ncbi:MAG: hypothetical protein U0271_32210 [Polyangiaceae bacterium]
MPDAHELRPRRLEAPRDVLGERGSIGAATPAETRTVNCVAAGSGAAWTKRNARLPTHSHAPTTGGSIVTAKGLASSASACTGALKTMVTSLSVDATP